MDKFADKFQPNELMEPKPLVKILPKLDKTFNVMEFKNKNEKLQLFEVNIFETFCL